jgi:hypothetical protein
MACSATIEYANHKAIYRNEIVIPERLNLYLYWNSAVFLRFAELLDPRGKFSMVSTGKLCYAARTSGVGVV